MVKGAERVRMRTLKGEAIDITSYVAHDPATDLIVLATGHKGPKLSRGTHRLFSPAQTLFVLLPPSVPQVALYTGKYVSAFDSRGVGEVIGLWADISTGLPVVDSLGNVSGIVELLEAGNTRKACAIPVERVTDLLARPDPGGKLADLATEPVPAWTQTDRPEGALILGSILCRTRQFDTGLLLLNRAVAGDPSLLEAKLELGMAHQIRAKSLQLPGYLPR